MLNENLHIIGTNHLIGLDINVTVGVSYNLWLTNVNIEYIDTIESIKNAGQGNILTRQNLFDLSIENEEEKLKLFFASLIWGSGKWNLNRGRLLRNNRQELTLIISCACNFMDNRNWENAFHELLKIHGLGVAFLTKFMYFYSKKKKLPAYPLILDSRVAKSLRTIAVGDPDFENFNWLNSNTPLQKYRAYKKYLDLIHMIATEQNIEADKYEYYLFDKKGVNLI